jgi:hypothetical protein
MSKVSKSIFVLKEKQSEIIHDYLDLCFIDKIDTYKTSLLSCCCCENDKESVMPFSSKDKYFKDNLTKWVYDLSMSYIRKSGIDCTKLRLYTIECIRSPNPIIIKNSKEATVIFHFTDKYNGYVTTHDTHNGILNYSSDERKYIVVVYEA